MKHKVFISYHHKNDFHYRQKFEKLLCNKYDVLDSRAVQPNEIKDVGTEEFRRLIREKHLRDSTVTVVLIGEDTWRRKHVDYEIKNSLRDTQNSHRSGLLGIILPSYRMGNSNKYNPRTLPKRLFQNVTSGYSNIHFWSENPWKNQDWIHQAFLKRKSIIPNNSMAEMVNNWKGNEWT